MAGERGLVVRLRSSGGPSLVLLQLLAAHRVMSTQQAARATATAERTVLYRLDKLRGAGLVNRVRPGRETGSAPLYWFLRPAGAQLVTGAVPVGVRQPSGLFVAHAAAITECWLALTEHGPQHGLVLSEWRTDRAAWQQWAPSAAGTWAIPGQEQRLTPDALLGVQLHAPTPNDGGAEPTGEVAAFMEVDLATMTQTQLRMKLTRYQRYAADRAWAGWATACPPMLLLTTSEARAATFIRATVRALKPDRGSSTYPRSRDEQIMDRADRLVVAAAGLVRDPARAVMEPVWLLGDETFTPVTLGELLADRYTTGAQAVVIRHHREQVQQHKDTLWWLGRAIGEARHRLNDDRARQILDHLDRPGHVEQLLTDHPRMARLLLDWRQRHDQETTDKLTAALHRGHRSLWVAQARRLLAASEHRQAQSAAFVRALLTLGRDELLGTWDEQALDQSVPTDPEPDWDTYQREQAEHIDSVWAALPRARRWRTSREQIGEAYDHEHQRVCGRCAQTVPLPARMEHRHYVNCPRCGAPDDELRPLADRDQVPTLETRVDRLTELLAERTQPRAVEAA